MPTCLIIRGHNVQGDDKALHKCQQEERKFEHLKGGKLAEEQRPTGFCSSITVGSLLPFKTAIMKGSIVELLARRCVGSGGCHEATACAAEVLCLASEKPYRMSGQQCEVLVAGGSIKHASGRLVPCILNSAMHGGASVCCFGSSSGRVTSSSDSSST